MIVRGAGAAMPPEIDADSRWFWDALGKARLVVPRCDACARVSFPPMPACPYCAAASFSRVDATGQGSVYSWVTVHIPLDPAFTDEAPYTILTVTLDEEPAARIVGRLLDADASQVHAGAPVRFTPYRVRDDVVLPGFVLAESTRGT